jgi:uncharacterized membrane protein YkoI
MKCSKCGHENSADAKFCEKCGSTIQSTAYNSGNSKSDEMKTSTKALIAVVVILVAGLGLIIGLSTGNQNHLAINATNNTNPTVNSGNQSQSVQNTSTKKSNSSNGMITATQAGNIALAHIGAGWKVTSVDFVPAANYENTPNYMVELTNQRSLDERMSYPSGSIESAAETDVRINAQTGAIMEG